MSRAGYAARPHVRAKHMCVRLSHCVAAVCACVASEQSQLNQWSTPCWRTERPRTHEGGDCMPGASLEPPERCRPGTGSRAQRVATGPERTCVRLCARVHALASQPRYHGVARIWHAGECSWTRHLCVLSVVASVPMCTADGRLRFIAFGVCDCRIGSLLNACECESIVLRIYRF